MTVSAEPDWWPNIDDVIEQLQSLRDQGGQIMQLELIPKLDFRHGYTVDFRVEFWMSKGGKPKL